MARAATPKASPTAIEPGTPDAFDAPTTYTFEPFAWTPQKRLDEVTVPVAQLCNLIDHVKDVASAAAMIFELSAAHEAETYTDGKTYLNPFQVSLLQRLALRSLSSLDAHAEKLTQELYERADGAA